MSQMALLSLSKNNLNDLSACSRSKVAFKADLSVSCISFIHHNANCFYDSTVGTGLKVLVSLLEHSVDNILVLCVHLLCLADCPFNLKKKTNNYMEML